MVKLKINMDYINSKNIKVSDKVKFFYHGKYWRDTKSYEVEGEIIEIKEDTVFKNIEFEIYCPNEQRKAIALDSKKNATRVPSSFIIEKL